MRIAISVGHAAKVRGASGPEPWGLDEVDEAYRVVNEVAKQLQSAGVEVEKFFDTISTSQNENLNRIVNWHNDSAFNGAAHELDVSVHFNAYKVTSSPMGCEVCYLTQENLADEASAAMAEALMLPDRGGKYRNDLFFLGNTAAPAVLAEVCFVDSSTDAEHYRARFESLCRALAESLSGVEIQDPSPPVTEPEPEPPPTGTTENNRVIINSKIAGDVTVYVNDMLMSGHDDCEHVISFKVETVGDVALVINGEAFHNKPPAEAPGIAPNHTSIEATVFGGSDDPNNSAYPPFELLDGDNDLFVALPYSFSNDLFPHHAPKVRVYRGEVSVVGAVADKGPWTTDDAAYVHGSARPMAETCYDEGAPLPSGPNAGKVPSNRAGIDLSPALAEIIGISGKGIVDWEFVEG